MIRIYNTQADDPRPFLQSRSVRYEESVGQVVSDIIQDVRERGDLALLDSARKFDSPGIDRILATPQEIDGAMPLADHAFAIDHAIERVKAFHESQLVALTKGWQEHEYQSTEVRQKDGQPRHHVANHRWTWNMAPEGSQLGQRMSPLQRVGAYVPGGNANYPSSVIMNVVPAQVAGVNHVTVTTPVRQDGTLSPAVLYASRYCGVAKVVKVGGAAAIAALALGTESVDRVDKIVGPGNRYVNEAKRQLWGGVGLDGYAGPSEVCVVVDETANARFAAADFLTQIEHAPDNAGFLVSTSEAKANEILAEIEVQLKNAPRESTMRQAIAVEGAVIVARDINEACEIINLIAPEHLTISTKNPEEAMAKIQNAGCILLGEWTPESAGDYCAGPSHTLPTATSARFGSPVNVPDFLKIQSVLKFNREELSEMRETIRAFCEMEGFPAHGYGSEVRFEGEV
ncbi:MAG: histidinol dehydrogenase [Chlorobia bacterium]|nr:histidinol dehydrogenase [Fimbriimonadaceae bacterium]